MKRAEPTPLPVVRGRWSWSVLEQHLKPAAEIRLAEADLGTLLGSNDHRCGSPKPYPRLNSPPIGVSATRETDGLSLTSMVSQDSRGLVCAGDWIDPVAGFEFVNANQADQAGAMMCRMLGVSSSG